MFTTDAEPYWIILLAHGDTPKNQKHLHGAGLASGDERLTKAGFNQANAAGACILRLITSNSEPSDTGTRQRWLVPVWTGTTYRLEAYGAVLRQMLMYAITHYAMGAADISVTRRIYPHPDLDKIKMGHLEAKTKEEMMVINRAVATAIRNWMLGLGPAPDMPGGEKAADFYARYERGLRRAAQLSLEAAGRLGARLVLAVVVPGSGIATAHHCITAPTGDRNVHSIGYTQGQLAAYRIHSEQPEMLTSGFVDPTDLFTSGEPVVAPPIE